MLRYCWLHCSSLMPSDITHKTHGYSAPQNIHTVEHSDIVQLWHQTHRPHGLNAAIWVYISATSDTLVDKTGLSGDRTIVILLNHVKKFHPSFLCALQYTYVLPLVQLNYISTPHLTFSCSYRKCATASVICNCFIIMPMTPVMYQVRRPSSTSTST